VEEYDTVMKFHAERNHMYIKSKKDPKKKWVQMKYNITKEDIQLFMQCWVPNWKILAEGDTTAQGGSAEATHHTDVEMNPPGNGLGGNDQGNDT
jgi:hypothetical protein